MKKKIAFCPQCHAQIEGTPKFCPACGMKFKKKRTGLIIAGCILALILIIGIGGGGSEDTGAADNGDTTTQTDTPEEVITYTPYTVDEMVDELEENALRAEEKYQDQYVEITGRLDVIDSDGKYISLYPMNDEWALNGVQCDIMNDEQKAQVIEMNEGDTVTVRGKITTVGEILSYALDIDEIVS